MPESSPLPGVRLPFFTVANLPAPASFEGELVRCTNGHDGQPCLAISNGSVWINQFTNAPVSAATLNLASLPAAATYPGAIRHCSNGNAGAATLVRSDGTNWKVLALGATAS